MGGSVCLSRSRAMLSESSKVPAARSATFAARAVAFCSEMPSLSFDWLPSGHATEANVIQQHRDLHRDCNNMCISPQTCDNIALLEVLLLCSALRPY